MNPSDAAARLMQLSGQFRALAQSPPRGVPAKKRAVLRGRRRAVQAKAGGARRDAEYRSKIIQEVKRRLG